MKGKLAGKKRRSERRRAKRRDFSLALDGAVGDANDKKTARRGEKSRRKRRSRRFFALKRAPVACVSDDSGYNKVSEVALVLKKEINVDNRFFTDLSRGDAEKRRFLGFCNLF